MYKDDLRQIQKTGPIQVQEHELEGFFKSPVWKAILQLVVKDIATNEDTLRFLANDFIAVTDARASLNRLEWFIDIEKMLITQHIVDRAKDAGAAWQTKAKEITDKSEYFKKKLCSSMEHDTIDAVKLIETYVSKHGDSLNGPSNRSNRSE
jgi:hypothetical protein